MLAVFSHTSPGLPPGAAVLVLADVFEAELAGVDGAGVEPADFAGAGEADIREAGGVAGADAAVIEEVLVVEVFAPAVEAFAAAPYHFLRPLWPLQAPVLLAPE